MKKWDSVYSWRTLILILPCFRSFWPALHQWLLEHPNKPGSTPETLTCPWTGTQLRPPPRYQSQSSGLWINKILMEATHLDMRVEMEVTKLKQGKGTFKIFFIIIRCPYDAPKMCQMNLTSNTSKMTLHLQFKVMTINIYYFNIYNLHLILVKPLLHLIIHLIYVSGLVWGALQRVHSIHTYSKSTNVEGCKYAYCTV